MSNPSYFFSTILKTLSVLLFLAMSQSIYAQQTIVEYEFWFNDDFNNRTITAITPVSQYHLDTSLSVSNLPNGINVIKFRAKDSQGKYSVITSQLFYKKEITNSGTNHLVSYEYWFDDDFQNRTLVNITPTEQATVLEQLDVSNMSNGMHLFNLRAKDERGYYSSIVSQFFYKKELTNSDTNHLVSYEYWFDDDFQNKTVVDISPAEQSTVLAQLDVSTMSNGMHLFNFRAKDERGYYSSIASQLFYKKQLYSYTDNKIIAYKYWLDDDYNNVTFVNIATPVDNLHLISLFDMTRIPKGIHTINFQFKDDANFWSVISTDTIEKISLPIADYTYEVLSSNCDSTVISFTDNSIDGDVYLWDFADGTTDTLANPTHTFYNSGVHSVILTITDTTTLADSTKQMDILITGHTANLFAVTSCDSYTSPSGNYTYTTSGVYYDTITNHWGCDSLLTIDLNITYSFFSEENINICQGETYTWHGQTLNTAGTYYDSLTTVNGCDSIYKLSLNVNSLPNINLGNDTIVCGAGITLNAGSGFTSYYWNTDETTQSINITNSGLYSVTVTNPQNCSNSDEINVTISNISINLEQIGADLIATLNPIVSGEYAWYTCDNQLVPNITTATYQNAPIDGCFYVIFTDEVNCEWTSNEVNVVSIQDNGMNIARVYPNPANDVVYIELINDKAVSIYLYDMLGKLILNEKHNDSLIKIDVSQLNGTYILKVVNENKQSIFRLTIID
ncbi:MAG TPA: T9SS type A sorting domain-containing protein [Bacteroidales bacterium]|nr:T9SS type A sorting domain-containing protein [Bacteroidales bacterium]